MLYFNYAGLSPTRAEVAHVMQETAHVFGTLLYSQSGIDWYRKQAEECGAQIAALVDLSPGTIHHLVLCPNSTLAYRIVLSLLPLERGDLVLCSDQEHSSTWRALADVMARGVVVEAIPGRSPDEFLTRLEQACRKPKATFLTLSHVAHSDGRVFPVQEACRIARARGLIVAIDGAQAVGHVPVSVRDLDLDFYYFSGHKWCAGPMGSGALVITDQFQEHRRTRSANSATGPPEPLEVDLGTQSIAQIAGLGLACALRQQEWARTTRLGQLRTELVRQLDGAAPVVLAGWNGPHAPGIASFGCPDVPWDPTRIADQLATEEGIVVRPLVSAGLPPALRASWSATTELQHLTLLAGKLLEAIRRFA